MACMYRICELCTYVLYLIVDNIQIISVLLQSYIFLKLEITKPLKV